MRIIVAKDAEGMAERAADWIAARIRAKPDLRIAWCTGRTVIPVYRKLTAMHREGRLTFAEVRCYDIDEYAGLPSRHPASFRRFLMDRLLEPVGVPIRNIRLLDGSAPDLERECQDFEECVEAAGGIDLLLDGIGTNGHLGFNEPGTPFGSRTRLVNLTEETREAQLAFFPSLDHVPRRALTRGIRDIMQARSIMIMASGAHKAAPLGAAFLGPVTEEIPSSVLQLHPDVTLFADAEAARPLLKNRLTARYVEGDF